MKDARGRGVFHGAGELRAAPVRGAARLLLDDMPAAESRPFGYSTASVHQMATMLRKGRLSMFAEARPAERAPKATGSSAAGLELRAAGTASPRSPPPAPPRACRSPRRPPGRSSTRRASAGCPPRRRPPRPRARSPRSRPLSCPHAGPAAGPAVRHAGCCCCSRDLRPAPAGPDHRSRYPSTGRCRLAPDRHLLLANAPQAPHLPRGHSPTTPGWRSPSG